MTTNLKQEQQADIIRWVEEHDIPIFPAYTRTKTITFPNWQELDLSKENFRDRLANGDYDNGIAIRTGKTLTGKNGKYLVVADIDKKPAVDAWFRDWNQVIVHANKGLIEWHNTQESLHIFFYTDEPMKNKIISLEGGQIEIRCEKLALFVSPSITPDGNSWKPLGTSRTIPKLDHNRLLGIEARIDVLSKDYMSSERKEEYKAWLDDPNTIIGDREGRHPATVFMALSNYFKYAGDWLWLDDEERFERTWEWHLAHCKPPRTRKHCNEIFEWVVKVKKADQIEYLKPIKENWERKKEQKEKRDQSSKYNKNKRRILDAILKITDENTGGKLEQNIWTLVSENPMKFIVARTDSKYICKASVTFYDSGENQTTKKVYLNYGAIMIRLFPKSITLHENPLKFLEASPQYTIVFENYQKQEVVVNGSINVIVSKLKEMPGYVVSQYGITEALTAIIGAFADDGKLQIDRTVEFEGYYLYENEIQISRINFDEKHPIRTKEEVIECIKYLNKRAEFQVWTYNGREIDRQDLLATMIKWTFLLLLILSKNN